MRIINDSDTTEFVDGTGDKLVLLIAPRQRDLEACEAIERKAALGQLKDIQAMGIDTDKALAEAGALDPETLKQAEESARSSLEADPEVRAFRMNALAVRLVVGGESIGGKAIAEAYGKMDGASAAWIDARVAKVWDASIPSEADTRDTGAHADVPERPCGTSAEERACEEAGAGTDDRALQPVQELQLPA